MIHNGHCFHCGHIMTVGSQECGNPLCRVDEQARPTWPWSRCAGDETIALLCLSFMRGLLWLLLPALGILLFLTGNVFTSGRLIDIGLTCIGGWLLSRYLLSLVRNANFNLYMHERSRRDAQEQWDMGNVPDTPKLKKELDDEYDGVEHDQWAVRGFRWLKMTVNLATALLIMLFILSWGPGDILHWESMKNWGHKKIEKAVNSPIVADTKRELSWDNNRLNYLENMLRRKKGFAYEQFREIVNYKNFEVEAVISMLKTTKLRGNKLYDDIKIRLDAIAPPSSKVEETKAFAQKTQERFHVLRETYWQILFWFNTLLFLFVTGSLIMMPLSFAIAKGIMFGDEIKDIVMQKIEEYEEKRKEKTDVKATPAVAKVIKEAVSSEGGKHGIVSIGVISLITDLIFDKLLRKFFQ